MRQAVVNVGPDTLEDRGFQFGVFQDAGVLEAEILSCEGSRGVFRVHVEEQLEPRRLDTMDAIQWWEQVSSEGSASVYLIEADGTEARDTESAEDDPFPRCERIQVTDQGLVLTWAGPRDRLHEALAQLATHRDDISLERLHEYQGQTEPLDALTDRQRNVLRVAFERGYYDIPRQTSVQEIADEFDLDDSTIAEHLQRAERNLLRMLFGSASA